MVMSVRYVFSITLNKLFTNDLDMYSSDDNISMDARKGIPFPKNKDMHDLCTITKLFSKLSTRSAVRSPYSNPRCSAQPCSPRPQLPLKPRILRTKHGKTTKSRKRTRTHHSCRIR